MKIDIRWHAVFVIGAALAAIDFTLAKEMTMQRGRDVA